jgi:hypothetical protein
VGGWRGSLVIPPAFVPGQAEQTRPRWRRSFSHGVLHLHHRGLARSPEGGTKANGMTRRGHVARIAQHNVGVDRFDVAAVELLPGQRVRARVLSHERWGVLVEIIGHERVGASIDMIELFGRGRTDRELAELTPVIGAEIDAVVEQIRRWHPPVWVRLSIRPNDLESFQWRCDFCAEPTTLSRGGDGVVLDVRSNDGPGSHSIISHRDCLADSLHPTSSERARVARVGRG